MKRALVLFIFFVLALTLSGCQSMDTQTQNNANETSDDLSSLTPDGEFVLGGYNSTMENILLQRNKVYLSKTTGKFSMLYKIKKALLSRFDASADESTIAKGQESAIIDLPKDIKRIRIIDQDIIAYLVGCDDKDHAKSLATHAISSDKETTIYSPSDGFVIDEYVLSPDGSLAALWEVKFAKDSDQLIGGISRIVEVNLKTKEYKVLITQQTTKPDDGSELAKLQLTLNPKVFVQYPLFYDSSNTLYLDTFGPNGGGWGNGIYTIASGSNQLQAFSSLPAGSYSYDPTGSEDGKLFVAVVPENALGQDRLSVQQVQEGGKNLAIFVDSKATTVSALDGVTITSSAVISPDNRYIAYNGKGSKSEQASYIYDRTTRQTNKYETGDYAVVEFIAQNKLVLGQADTSTYTGSNGKTNTLVANLGSKYNTLFGAYKIVDPQDSKNIIDYKPSASGAVEHVQGAWKLTGTSASAEKSNYSDSNNLNVSSFAPRNIELASTRVEAQQTIKNNTVSNEIGCEKKYPGINNLRSWNADYEIKLDEILQKSEEYKNLSEECRAAHDDYYKIRKSGGWGQGTDAFSRWTKCLPTLYANSDIALCVPLRCEIVGAVNHPNMKCYDSPLYLYPEQQIEVLATTRNRVFETGPRDTLSKWLVTADKDGTITDQNGKVYDKISYDYSSDELLPKQDGIVVSANQLEPSLEEYAKNLGLNEKESSDFVSYWYNKLNNTAPFIQMSHYSRAQSAEIVKMDIDPRPDTFVPIVMYFKKLYFPTILPKPTFEPILTRDGFFALDWSGVVE